VREYLRARGISVTGYNKQALVKLATYASRLSLEIDPDFANIDGRSDQVCIAFIFQ
jgi:hypothetical protein